MFTRFHRSQRSCIMLSLLLACAASVYADTSSQSPRGFTGKGNSIPSPTAAEGATGPNAATGYTGSAAGPNTPGATGGGVSGDKGTSNISSVPLSDADLLLARSLVRANIAELEMAGLAQKRSQNPQVRSYAQQVVDDHTQIQEEINKLSRAKDIPLPAEPSEKHRQTIKNLSQLQGDAFDREFVKATGLEDHQHIQKLLQQINKEASDPSLKALARKMIPKVEQHIQTAKNVSNAKDSMTSSGR